MSYPALVEPAAELTIDEVRRYSRHLIIPDVGMTGQKRLKNAKVLVIGAGGLGSPALLYLAAAGVGTLGIAEFDEVDESNLQRQIIHGQSDIGRSKAESARDSIKEANPYVEVVLHDERLDNDNVLQVFEGYDLIVDGTDNFATRYMVNDAAYFLKIPYVWGSIYRFDGQASVFWPHAETEDGQSAEAPCYRCLYPEPPPPGMVPSCAEGGVLGVLCASIGSIQVNEAIKLLTGIGDPLVGKLMIYDALEMEYRKLRVRKDPDCALCGDNPTVTELIDYETFCGAVSEEAADAAVGSTISVVQLEHMLKERDERARDFVLVDVREPNEYEINKVPGSVLIPKGEFLNGNALEQLPSDKQIVMYCKTGAAFGGDPGDREGCRVRRRGSRRRWGRGLGQPDRPVAAELLNLACPGRNGVTRSPALVGVWVNTNEIREHLNVEDPDPAHRRGCGHSRRRCGRRHGDRHQRRRIGRPDVGACRNRQDPSRHDDVHRRCPVHGQLRVHRLRRQRVRRVRRPLRRHRCGHRHRRLQGDQPAARDPGHVQRRRQRRRRGHPGRFRHPRLLAPGSPRSSSAPRTRTPARTTTWLWSRSTRPTSPRSTRRFRSGAAPPASTPTAPPPATGSTPTATPACGAASAQLSPHTGVSLGDDAADGGWSHPLYTVSPGIPGDSGSAFVSADGKAIGTLSTLGLAPLPASNNIGDLAKELAFAQQHSGISGLQMVNGTEAFDPVL